MKLIQLLFYPLLILSILFIVGCECDECDKDGDEELVIVNEPQANLLAATTVEIIWGTNFPSISVVYYGLTEAMGDSVVDIEEREHHVVILVALEPDTLYYYRAANSSEYFSGNPISEMNTFATTDIVVGEELVIVAEPQTVLLDPTTIEIHWETNFPSRSVVNYGLTEAMENTAEDQEERENHIVTIAALEPDTMYFYRVSNSSEYFSGNPESAIDTFMTTDIVVGEELQIVAEPQTVLLDPTTIEIHWQTNLPSGSVVHYGLTEAMENTAEDQEERENHVITITALEPDTLYYYRVANSSEYFSGNPISEMSTFATSMNELSYVVQGWQYFSNGDYGNALESYSSALQLNVNSGAAYMGRGWCYLRLENMTSALEALNTGLGFNPDLLEGYTGRAVVYLHQQLYAEAISDGMVVLETDSAFVFAYEHSIDHVMVRLVMAQAYYATQQYEMAQEQCDVIAPDNGLDLLMPESWIVNGTVYDTYLEALLALIQYLVLQT